MKHNIQKIPGGFRASVPGVVCEAATAAQASAGLRDALVVTRECAQSGAAGLEVAYREYRALGGSVGEIHLGGAEL